MYYSLNDNGDVNFETSSLDFEANETTPLINSQPGSSGYLGLSSSSALSIPDNNRSLQLSNAALENIENQERPQVETKQFKLELEKRINKEYPKKYIFFNSIVSIIFCIATIISERIQTDSFHFDDLKVISYRTLSGFVLLASSVNIIYSVLALVSSIKLNPPNNSP